MMQADQLGKSRARTRSGCMNCRRKKRKCDEAKPDCTGCARKGEKCEWGMRVTFRAENARGITSHPSLQRIWRPTRKPTRFEIRNVTAEVIRDYHLYEPSSFTPQDLSNYTTHPDNERAPTSNVALRAPVASSLPTADEHDTVQVHTELGWQSQADHADLSHSQANKPETQYSDTEVTNIPNSLSTSDAVAHLWPSPTASGPYDDSIFLPGSAYLDLHSTLQTHLIHEVRSTAPTRSNTPGLSRFEDDWPATGAAVELSEDEEFALWKNWLDEIAPWLDKFDSRKHFQHTLPIMARSHAHLRYSMLAVSARQLERKERSQHTERSLALYQMAIHLVLPQLHTRSTAVIASCVVLCVLEMLSSSPNAWRQHLDGCAHLMDAVGINGFVGGVGQALFWCFARMDVCGGLITSMKTLIPVDRWASGIDLDADYGLFRSSAGFDMYANYAVYLCAQVLDLLAFHPHLAQRLGASTPSAYSADAAFTDRWTKLWRYIADWHIKRPEEMLPISSFSSKLSPFPMVLYSNPAAISGNQLYHTASILMLQHKPSAVVVIPKPRSIFWHARQICAISTSNHHHGAWTNCIQPLWIAGQWMSHSSEQKAILELLERIEKEVGWGTKWRAKDLKEFWGDE